MCHHDYCRLLRNAAPPLRACLHHLLDLIVLDRWCLPDQHRAVRRFSIAHFEDGGCVDRVALDRFRQLTRCLGVDGCGVESYLNVVLVLTHTHMKGPGGLKRGFLVLAHLGRVVH